MFCADYIASFLCHGFICGSLNELNKYQNVYKFDLGACNGGPFFFGAIAGLCGAASVYPFDFVRRGVIEGQFKFRHSLSTVPYAAAFFGLYFTLRDANSTPSQCKCALFSGFMASLAEMPFDKAKLTMMGSRRTMLLANALYVPFGAMILVMYDKAFTNWMRKRNKNLELKVQL
ncbi:uncharacterized protein LOC142337233 [Convolutriloba macropyga]|uniref:uncharacterized protein LOC142337233 n=1 Tax=Convolutriloba macropyga TaxID=536237 RepID=UPI003F51EE47